MGFIRSVFIFLTILMWIDFILSFVSKTINNVIIESLQEQNKMISNRRMRIKLLLRKIFKK